MSSYLAFYHVLSFWLVIGVSIVMCLLAGSCDACESVPASGLIVSLLKFWV